LTKKILVSALVSALACGCLPSLNAYYTEDNVVFMEKLLGAWGEPGAAPAWEVSRGSGKTYRLIQTDEGGNRGYFDGHLFKAGDTLLLDLYPREEGMARLNKVMRLQLVPTHLVMRIEHTEPRLKLSFLNPDWLKDYLEENPGALAHEKVADTILLTAQPNELQDFLKAHAATPDAFKNFAELARCVCGESPPGKE